MSNKAYITIAVLSIIGLTPALLEVNRHFAPRPLKEFNESILKQDNNFSITPICLIESKPVCKEPESFIHIDQEDLVKDILDNYPTTPTRAKMEAIDAIMELEQTYNINPLITYSVGHVESSWNPYIVHKETIIEINNKKVKVQARGSHGMVFEWWGDKLIEAGIIQNKADLFDPILSIKAFGFVYNELRQMPMHPLAKNKDESALLRYFGGSYKSYLDRIDEKIGSLIANKLYRSK